MKFSSGPSARSVENYFQKKTFMLRFGDSRREFLSQGNDPALPVPTAQKSAETSPLPVRSFSLQLALL
ncbi:hypothetical protein, partial [Deinococcus multiflagellatus]|uniref:hypothetical protein n=1 Tax=Deinococcus multiflagellatus TaxID=1656887 RepID=UPI001CC8F45C